MDITTALARTKDINTDRLCENCGHDWRGNAECPVCDHVTLEDAPDPLTPEGPSLVTVCSWCPNAREATAAALAFGRIVTHGICASCEPKFLAEGRF